MAYNAYPMRCTQPEVWMHVLRLQGTGANVPTKNYGDGVTVTRSGVGDLLLTWGDNPGHFIGIVFGLTAVTGGDVDGWTPVSGTYSAANRTLAIRLFDEAAAAADLAANTYLTIGVLFKTTAV